MDVNVREFMDAILGDAGPRRVSVPPGVCPKCLTKKADLRPWPPETQGPCWCAECRLSAAVQHAKAS